MTSPLRLRLRRSVSSWVRRDRRAFRAVWGRLVLLVRLGLLDRLVPLRLFPVRLVRRVQRVRLGLLVRLARLVRPDPLARQGLLVLLVRPGRKVTRVTLARQVLQVRLGRPDRQGHKGQPVPQARPGLRDQLAQPVLLGRPVRKARKG
jgi:hypothetical protein